MKKPSLKDFTIEELKKELARRERKALGAVKGYRVTYPGDEYSYGTTSDYRIGDFRYTTAGKVVLTKSLARSLANEAAKEEGGYVSPIYKSTPKPKFR